LPAVAVAVFSHQVQQLVVVVRVVIATMFRVS
jgi:hypothetical protein